jgi:hypothetical protein
MKFLKTFLVIAFLFGYASAQTLLPVEEFNSDILIHGTSAPATVWFAPSYNTPIDWTATGGCPDGRIGYSSSWNDYWGNFVRLPQINCTGNDTVILTFDVSHSFFSAHVNDWCRFYVWADNEYKKNVVSVIIDSVDVTYDAGINGKGFKFDQARSCASVEVLFDLTAIADKSNILFYIEPSCGYNNSNLFYFWIDNVMLSGYSGSTVNTFQFINQREVLVFPSPAHDLLNVRIRNQDQASLFIEVYDIYGILRISEKHQCGSFNINISDLESGVYLIKCSQKNKPIFQTNFVKL